MLCDKLEGSHGVGEGRWMGSFKREGTQVYLCLIHVWQKLIHYKAIILQSKIHKLKKKI